jgi:hypothetical protein
VDEFSLPVLCWQVGKSDVGHQKGHGDHEDAISKGIQTSNVSVATTICHVRLLILSGGYLICALLAEDPVDRRAANLESFGDVDRPGIPWAFSSRTRAASIDGGRPL